MSLNSELQFSRQTCMLTAKQAELVAKSERNPVPHFFPCPCQEDSQNSHESDPCLARSIRTATTFCLAWYDKQIEFEFAVGTYQNPQTDPSPSPPIERLFNPPTAVCPLRRFPARCQSAGCGVTSGSRERAMPNGWLTGHPTNQSCVRFSIFAKFLD